jgi:hypothetical protein
LPSGATKAVPPDRRGSSPRRTSTTATMKRGMSSKAPCGPGTRTPAAVAALFGKYDSEFLDT